MRGLKSQVMALTQTKERLDLILSTADPSSYYLALDNFCNYIKDVGTKNESHERLNFMGDPDVNGSNRPRSVLQRLAEWLQGRGVACMAPPSNEYPIQYNFTEGICRFFYLMQNYLIN